MKTFLTTIMTAAHADRLMPALHALLTVTVFVFLAMLVLVN